jgi:5-oxoprolinase (ATP-hydrolysing) subunit C
VLKVVRAQGQGLVSDGGRFGLQGQGVPVGGVLDAFSYRIANAALGNPPGLAALELMGKFEFVCTESVELILGSRASHASLDGRVLHDGQVYTLQAGDVLHVNPARVGFWTLLCVRGGFDVPPVLGSRSTCLAAGFGGYEGRALQVGDTLPIGNTAHCAPALKQSKRLSLPFAVDQNNVLRVACVAGPEFDCLTEESRHAFANTLFDFNIQSSRMGFRLDPACGPMGFSLAKSWRSVAVQPGIVQMPPGGRPVVLLSEAQTTGGYPRVASVLSSDLWKLAQFGPDVRLQFEWVSRQAACERNRSHAKDWMFYQQVIENHVDQR